LFSIIPLCLFQFVCFNVFDVCALFCGLFGFSERHHSVGATSMTVKCSKTATIALIPRHMFQVLFSFFTFFFFFFCSILVVLTFFFFSFIPKTRLFWNQFVLDGVARKTCMQRLDQYRRLVLYKIDQLYNGMPVIVNQVIFSFITHYYLHHTYFSGLSTQEGRLIQTHAPKVASQPLAAVKSTQSFSTTLSSPSSGLADVPDRLGLHNTVTTLTSGVARAGLLCGATLFRRVINLGLKTLKRVQTQQPFLDQLSPQVLQAAQNTVKKALPPKQYADYVKDIEQKEHERTNEAKSTEHKADDRGIFVPATMQPLSATELENVRFVFSFTFCLFSLLFSTYCESGLLFDACTIVPFSEFI
jgi:hypothetical protein